MASVPLPVTKHKLIIPWRILTEGKLTMVQVESVLHACTQVRMLVPCHGTSLSHFPVWLLNRK